MAFFLAGVVTLIVLLLAARLLTQTDPRLLAAALRRVGGGSLLLLAFFLIARGALPLAIPVGMFGLALLGWNIAGFGAYFGGGRTKPGQKSHVRTEALEMELDHDTGHMEGRLLKGKQAGRALSDFSETELLALLAEFHTEHDIQDAALLEAYFDWRLPGWRDKAGTAEGGEREQRPRPGATRMSVEEALDVLGLEPGAGADAVREAHRRLMKKLHPDQGGSNYLAARINEAKGVLLARNGAQRAS
jgi:hypothetical protein